MESVQKTFPLFHWKLIKTQEGKQFCVKKVEINTICMQLFLDDLKETNIIFVGLKPALTAKQASSPKGKSIVCPVCMDSDGTIRESGRLFKSTICGHVFCEVCIKQAVQSQKKCPTCRKSLTHKQVHTLYI